MQLLPRKAKRLQQGEHIFFCIEMETIDLQNFSKKEIQHKLHFGQLAECFSHSNQIQAFARLLKYLKKKRIGSFVVLMHC